MLPSKPLLGVGLAALAAVSFAANTTAAKLAYDGGSNPLTYLSVRSVLAFFLVLTLVIAVRADLRMPLRRRVHAVGLGMVLALYSFGLMSAIEYIPVALATLIFYTFPLLTSLFMWSTGRDRPTPVSAAALAAGCGGLALALDIGGHELEPAGIALAALAAVGVTAVLILNNRLVGSGDSRPVTVHMTASASVVFLATTLLFGDYALPATAEGWAGFLTGTLCYAIAVISWFVALSIVGPIRASLTMNLEPVSSLFLGFAILGQTLTLWQVLGVAVVVGSVLAVRLEAGHRQPHARQRTSR